MGHIFLVTHVPSFLLCHNVLFVNIANVLNVISNFIYEKLLLVSFVCL